MNSIFSLKAVHRANRTTSENERMREQLNSLQERKNTLEYQLQEKEFALSELHIQLDEKTCCLQTTFDKAKSLEALLQTSNEKISSLEEKIEALLAERDSVSNVTFFCISSYCLFMKWLLDLTDYVFHRR